MGGHARPYFKHGRALPAHNGNFDAYGPDVKMKIRKQVCIRILRFKIVPNGCPSSDVRFPREALQLW